MTLTWSLKDIICLIACLLVCLRACCLNKWVPYDHNDHMHLHACHTCMHEGPDQWLGTYRFPKDQSWHTCCSPMKAATCKGVQPAQSTQPTLLAVQHKGRHTLCWVTSYLLMHWSFDLNQFIWSCYISESCLGPASTAWLLGRVPKSSTAKIPSWKLKKHWKIAAQCQLFTPFMAPSFLNFLPWTLEEELHDLHLALATGSVKCRCAVAFGVIQRLKVLKVDAQLKHIKVNMNKHL